MEKYAKGKLPDIRRTVEINSKVERVWQAVATSEGLANWLMPNDFQPELGYEFTLKTQFGLVPCKVTELDPPKRLSFTWDDFGWQVTFELKEIGGKTEFTVIHSGWGEPDAIIPRVQQKQSVIRETLDIGWGHLTEGLRGKLEKDDE
ncbi:MAG: SRPBCC domain-containing protein [Firmicutes bacterium]|nr:SRPBCC domain-containing protein [Bacillota bacterium]